jgi:hypothetical protein
MYWITKERCIKCKGALTDRNYERNEKYQTLKAIILEELEVAPSNGWPDEHMFGFDLGMIKIFVSNKNHDFKYKMKCFQCGYEVSGEEYEKIPKPLVKKGTNVIYLWRNENYKPSS